jgi:hypothetical protein
MSVIDWHHKVVLTVKCIYIRYSTACSNESIAISPVIHKCSYRITVFQYIGTFTGINEVFKLFWLCYICIQLNLWDGVGRMVHINILNVFETYPLWERAAVGSNGLWESKSRYDWQSVCLVVESTLGLMTRYCYLPEGICLKVVLSLCGALSDERSSLWFVSQSVVICQYVHLVFKFHVFGTVQRCIYNVYRASFIPDTVQQITPW